MIKRPNTNAQRLKRHKRVRAKVFGTTERPRLNVFRSEKNIYAQVIDDVAGSTLVSASSLDKEIEGNGGNKTAARAVGKLVAERAKAKGIETVVFDRGGYLYHGRVKALADAARAAGAGGGTVLHAKGTGGTRGEKFFSVSLADEKDMIYIIAHKDEKAAIMRSISPRIMVVPSMPGT